MSGMLERLESIFGTGTAFQQQLTILGYFRFYRFLHPFPFPFPAVSFFSSSFSLKGPARLGRNRKNEFPLSK
jgi:hypothetical protein